MRVLIWHGWLLGGSGSNVYAARIAEELTFAGHDVLLLCQESHPDRYLWIDAWASISPTGPSELIEIRPSSGPGRCVLLRPEIGRLLPVFVLDEYEGFDVKEFVELTRDDPSGSRCRVVSPQATQGCVGGSLVGNLLGDPEDVRL
jgi:hypothetical protein